MKCQCQLVCVCVCVCVCVALRPDSQPSHCCVPAAAALSAAQWWLGGSDRDRRKSQWILLCVPTMTFEKKASERRRRDKKRFYRLLCEKHFKGWAERKADLTRRPIGSVGKSKAGNANVHSCDGRTPRCTTWMWPSIKTLMEAFMALTKMCWYLATCLDPGVGGGLKSCLHTRDASKCKHAVCVTLVWWQPVRPGRGTGAERETSLGLKTFRSHCFSLFLTSVSFSTLVWFDQTSWEQCT